MKVSDNMNQFEVINNTIDYYKSLQAIKWANTCENKVLDYEIKTTRADMNIMSGVYKYALLPVWLVNTTWNGKTYTYAMNGQTGKFVGDIPTDYKKAKSLGALVGLGAGIAAYGIAWLIAILGSI